jgi:uncharacterized LabA/DUF88 family protein/cold shock CspA family protein
MLKAGIFIDSENLSRNGGRNLRYDVLRKLVEAQGATILRANAYLAHDEVQEKADPTYRLGKETHRNAIRRNGFHLVLKKVSRYKNDDGVEVIKANADIDLAVDALLQAENLDYILLGTGDGDFLRLVRALQSKGKRVDLLSFSNVNGELRREADYHFYGFLVPELVQQRGSRHIGTLHHVDENRGFGFITLREGLHVSDVRTDVFLHINDIQIDERAINMDTFLHLKARESLIEFDIKPEADGRVRAFHATDFKW